MSVFKIFNFASAMKETLFLTLIASTVNQSLLEFQATLGKLMPIIIKL